MEKLRKDLWSYKFSHIYVEKKAMDFTLSARIISKFKNSSVIEIEHYKDVFCRRNQNFTLQKKSPKLILAVKKTNLVYEGSQMCDNFGNGNFYYTSSVMNCIYDCEYCYLQGMYPSGNVVIFVNIDDTIRKIQEMLKKHPVYLCVSYDTDLMAVENITGFVHKWAETAAKHKNLKMEIRTKSACFDLIKDIPPANNVVLAWTLSPEKVIKEFEKGAPSLEKRLKSICDAIDSGWKVRICFDPILYIENWDRLYRECIETVFKTLGQRKVYHVSIGVFRVSKKHLKTMSRLRENSRVFAYPFYIENEICSYRVEHAGQMTNLVAGELLKWGYSL